ncbi:MAG: hypothetical protein ABIP94_08780 [Planctomycetota bacterium]
MRIPIVTLLAACYFVNAAAAQAIIAQNSGLANPGQVIDFGANVLPNFAPVTNQFPFITVSHASYFTTGMSNNLVGGFLTNDFSGLPNTLRIVFAVPLTDLSFVYHQIGNTGPSVVRAMLQGVTVDSFSGTWVQSQPNNYFGFTNTLFNELQIDFVGDFNVDTLAFNAPSNASCGYYNGTNVNPIDFTCLTLPVLGTTWQGAIATNANTLLTMLAYGPGGLLNPAVPLFGGELLIQFSPSPVLFTGAGSYSIAIPAASSWIGTALTFQGVRLDLVAGTPTIVPLNAIELVLGL